MDGLLRWLGPPNVQAMGVLVVVLLMWVASLEKRIEHAEREIKTIKSVRESRSN